MSQSDALDLPSLQKLQSAEQIELLDVVDSLRAQGLSEIVALPQLIVCGDQSSGKSSVLEAISGIPFPRQEILCTRFATEVILRRAVRSDISASIIPGKDRTKSDLDRLSTFKRDLNTQDDLKGLFKAAGDVMGLAEPGNCFSNDILRIEFCGPSQPQLTIVDLPGLIHSKTGNQAAGDVELVHKLVSRYLKNPRSIILAVVSAKSDYGVQIILDRAREVDPSGSRTLGIITKPDTLVNGSRSEESFIALAKNEDVKFALGWHVVRNLDSAIKTDQGNSRDEIEAQFFKESRFNSLPLNTIGVAFLRTRLSKVLFNQIQAELPRLVEDIQSQVSVARNIQGRLGPSRMKFEEQQSFLISLSQSFQSICRDAVRGDYDHDFFQDDQNPERRLCANVMNLHFKFADNMRKSGASWIIVEEEIDEESDEESDAENRQTREVAIKENRRTREVAIREASKLLKRSRGRELPGLPNPLLVGELFREYSRPWEYLAKTHIKNVWEATNRFLELAMNYLTDEDTCEKILRFWLYPIMDEKLGLAYDKLKELLEVHNDHPMTTNHHFINNSKSPKHTDSKAGLEEILKQEILKPGHKVTADEITRLLSNMAPKSPPDMDIIAAEEAFNNMNAFYDVALNLFTDNVPTLAIQAPIIRGVSNMFCPTAVFSMDPEVVKKIAGESEEKVTQRIANSRRLEILQNGARICKQYAKRPPNTTDIKNGANITALTSVNKGIKLESPDGNKKKSGKKMGGTAPKPPAPSIFADYKPDSGSSAFSGFTAPSQPSVPGSGLFGSKDGLKASATKPSSENSGLFFVQKPTSLENGEGGTKSSKSSGSSFGTSSNGSGATPAPIRPFVTPSGSGSSPFSSGSLFGSIPSKTTSTGTITQGNGPKAAEEPENSDIFAKPSGKSSINSEFVGKLGGPLPFTHGVSPFMTETVGMNGMDSIYSISSMPKFRDFSYEELRLKDYAFKILWEELAMKRKGDD